MSYVIILYQRVTIMSPLTSSKEAES